MSKRVKFSFDKLSSRRYRMLWEYLEKILGVDPSKYLPKQLYVTCFDEYCIIHEKAGREDKATLLYSGRWIGLIVHGKTCLSTYLYEEIYRERGYQAAIIVGDTGVKNFLYGRDVLEESIVEKYPPLNSQVAVIDQSDYRVIGVAEPIKEGVYRNIYDIGIFLRVIA